ncbi:MAG: DUF4191 domain-containing protein [Actinomycetes bacterium]
MSSRNASAPAKQKWYVQVRETYTFAKEHIRLLGLKLSALFLGTLGVMTLVGRLLGYQWIFLILGLPTAFLVTTYIFGRWASAAAYSSIEGQLGAAASVLQAMRGAWFAAPGVGVDKNQNLVHRIVGKPGIILVAEGSRPGALLAEQRKAHARFVQGAPIHEVIVGEGGLALTQLQKHIKKLPKALRPAEVTELRRRLEALPKTALPIPKGPMPQGRKVPRR